MKAPPDIDALPAAALRSLAIGCFERVGEFSGIVIELRDEIARLKGLKRRPDIKPPAVPRLLAQLRSIGIDISKRQLVRQKIAKHRPCAIKPKT